MFEPVRFGKYLLLDKIATGGMAEVYKAKSYGVMGFEKLLVIKKILPHLSRNKDFVSLFINEAKVSVSLNHANIVQVYDLGVVGTDYYIAMEFIHGADLMRTARRAAQSGQPLPMELACFIVAEMARGLDYAHNLKDPSGQPLNVVHRDISPHNVLISYEGDVKLVDFGIAQVGKSLAAEEGRIAGGKYAYMSPEHLGAAPVDPRSDIYSAGIVLFELTTGTRLYAGMSVEDKKQAILQGTIPRPSAVNPNIPPRLEQIIFNSLARDPALRYQGALELQDDLIAFLYESGHRVNRVDCGNALKRVFREEYDRDASSGSVVNNFDPEFDRLAASQPSSADQTDSGSARGGSTASRFNGSSVGGLRKRRWTTRRRGTRPSDAVEERSDPAPDPPRKSPRGRGSVDPDQDRPDDASFTGVSALTPSLDSGGLATEDERRLERLAEGERREVYVVAADIMGFDEISSRIDEEDLLRYNVRFLRAVLSVVRRFKGALDRFYNDRLLIFWGLGKTGAHDLELCLDCAAELAELGRKVAVPGVGGAQLCLGIHRGSLVAGGKGRRLRRFVPLGDTLKMAMRLCEMAEPGEVLVSDRVVSQTEEDWRFEALEPRPIKGRDRPVLVHRLGESVEPSVEAVLPEGGAWIARDTELEDLATAMERARSGETTLLAIRAESGAGKTRFLREIQRRSEEQGFAFYVGRGRFHQGQDPLMAVVDIARQILQLEPDADSDDIRMELRNLKDRYELRTTDLHLLGSLFGLEYNDSNLRYLSGDQRLAELFRALTQLLRRMAEEKPRVLAVQNLQWTDRLTRELVRHLHRSAGDVSLLIAVTLRPEDSLQVDRDVGRLVETKLGTLSPEGLRAYCKEFLGVSEVQLELADFVMEASGGNALFAKELLRSLRRDEIIELRDGAAAVMGRLEPSSVPDSVQDLIKSRIDALDKFQRLTLEVASVVGRAFALDLVSVALRSDTEKMEKTLEALVRTDLIRPRTGDGPSAVYRFRNILTWEVTYRSILGARRKEIHTRVGEAIEGRAEDGTRGNHELLSNHFKEGGQLARAADYAVRAAEVYSSSEYTQEAVRCYQRAILLLRSTRGEDTDESLVHRRLSEIYTRLADLHLEAGEVAEAKRHGNMALDYAGEVNAPSQEARALLVLSLVEHQHGSEEMATAYLARLEELVGVLDDGVLEVDVMSRLAEVLVQRGEFISARRALQAALQATQGLDGASGREALIHDALGKVQLREGDIDESVKSLGRALALARKEHDKALLGRVLEDLGGAQLRLGNHKEALKCFEGAYRISKGIEHKPGMATDLQHIGEVHLCTGDLAKAARYFRRAQGIARDADWAPGVAMADVYAGYLRSLQGATEEGRSQVRRGLDLAEKHRHWPTVATAKAMLARLLRRAGHEADARDLEADAWEDAARAGEPDLLRFLAEPDQTGSSLVTSSRNMVTPDPDG